jgi:hypothetical protein
VWWLDTKGLEDHVASLFGVEDPENHKVYLHCYENLSITSNVGVIMSVGLGKIFAHS